MKKYRNLLMNVKMILVMISFLFIFLPSLFAAEPIPVCLTADYSGVNGHAGIVQTKVIEMYMKNVNAAGGIKGRPIKLIIQDNGGDPSKALGIAKMFKDQYKCKVMLVDLSSSVCLALKPFGDANKIPMIAAAPQTEKLTVLNQKAWFFRTTAPAGAFVRAALVRVKNLGHTKIAYAGTTQAWGTDTLAQIKDFAPRYGLQLVHEVLSDPRTKDHTIQTRKMMSSGATAIVLCDFEAENASWARAIAATDSKPYVIHTSASMLGSAVALVDPRLVEGWETVSFADASRPIAKKVWTEANKYTGGNPIVEEDEKALKAYDAAGVLVEALKVATNLDDSTAIRDAIYNINPNWEHATGKAGSKGPFTTAKNNLADFDDFSTYVIRNGKMVVVK